MANERGTEAERKLESCRSDWRNERIRLLGQAERLGDKLKTATDALKEINIIWQTSCNDGETVDKIYAVANRALADIEGPNKETLEALNEPTIPVKDIDDFIEENREKPYTSGDIEGEDCKADTIVYSMAGIEEPEPDWDLIKSTSERSDVNIIPPIISQALLYLRDKLSKLEDTIEDIQAEIIAIRAMTGIGKDE